MCYNKWRKVNILSLRAQTEFCSSFLAVIMKHASVFFQWTHAFAWFCWNSSFIISERLVFVRLEYFLYSFNTFLCYLCCWFVLHLFSQMPEWLDLQHLIPGIVLQEENYLRYGNCRAVLFVNLTSHHTNSTL